MLENSQRRYKIAFLSSYDITVTDISLIELMTMSDKEGEDYEWKYAFSEKIDIIMDLQTGENMPIQSDRDNSKSLAFVLRYK